MLYFRENLNFIEGSGNFWFRTRMLSMGRDLPLTNALILFVGCAFNDVKLKDKDFQANNSIKVDIVKYLIVITTASII